MRKRVQKYLMGMVVFWCLLRGGAAFVDAFGTEEPYPQVEINIALKVYEDGRVPGNQKPQSIRWLLDWLGEEDDSGQKRGFTVAKYIKAVTINLVSDKGDDWLRQDSFEHENHAYLSSFFEDLKHIEQWVPIKRSFGQTSTDNFLHPLMRTKWGRLNTSDQSEYSTRLEEWKRAIEKRTTLEGFLPQGWGDPFSGVDILFPQVGSTGGGKAETAERQDCLRNEIQKFIDPVQVRESEGGFYASLAISFRQELARQWMLATFPVNFPQAEAIVIYEHSPELLWPDSSGCLMFDFEDLFFSYFARVHNWTHTPMNVVETVLNYLAFVKKHSTLTCYWENWRGWDPRGDHLPAELIDLLALASYPVGGINFVLPSTVASEDCEEYFERFERCVRRMGRVKKNLKLPKSHSLLTANDMWCPSSMGSPSSWAISLLCPAPSTSIFLDPSLQKAIPTPRWTWGPRPTFDIPLMGTLTSHSSQPRTLSRDTVAKAIRFAKREKCGLGFIFPNTALAELYLGTNFKANLVKWAIEEFLMSEDPEKPLEEEDDSHSEEEKPYWDHAHEGSNCYDAPGCREQHTHILKVN